MYPYLIFLLYQLKHSKQLKKLLRNIHFKQSASFLPRVLYLSYPESIPDTGMQFYNFYFVTVVHILKRTK